MNLYTPGLVSSMYMDSEEGEYIRTSELEDRLNNILSNFPEEELREQIMKLLGEIV